jgi:hypothetical protein
MCRKLNKQLIALDKHMLIAYNEFMSRKKHLKEDANMKTRAQIQEEIDMRERTLQSIEQRKRSGEYTAEDAGAERILREKLEFYRKMLLTAR